MFTLANADWRYRGDLGGKGFYLRAGEVLHLDSTEILSSFPLHAF